MAHPRRRPDVVPVIQVLITALFTISAALSAFVVLDGVRAGFAHHRALRRRLRQIEDMEL